MRGKVKYNFKKILRASIWLLLGGLLVVLSVSAMSRKSKESIADVHVNIMGAGESRFTSTKEIMDQLEKINGKKLVNLSIDSVDLTLLEQTLEKDKWIKDAEIFLDNNSVLQVSIKEYRPIARVFTTSGTSYYLSSELKRLPLTDHYLDRLPVFTDYPVGLSGVKDSALLEQVKTIGLYIGNHSFWMAQIDQIDITPEHEFTMVPKLGNQLIMFGNADNYGEKFNKLMAFYKKVQARTGWDRYSQIDLQFKNQIVAVRRDEAIKKSDSLKTLKEIARWQQEPEPVSISKDQQTTNHRKNIDITPLENAVAPAEKQSPGNSVNPHNSQIDKKQDKPEQKKVVPQPKKEVPVLDKKKTPVVKSKEVEPAPEKEKRVPKAVMPVKEKQDN